MIEGFKKVIYFIFSHSYVSNAKFDRTSRIGKFVKFTNSSIGRYSYVGNGSVVNNATIGNFTSISAGVKIGLGFHPLELLSTSPVFYTRKNIFNFAFVENDVVEEREHTVIGNDVLISAHVFIRDGVSIGNGSVIGAGSVVLSDVDDFAVVGGVPAKLIRYRFDDNTRKEIQRDPFWHWNHKKISSNLDKFKEKLR